MAGFYLESPCLLGKRCKLSSILTPDCKSSVVFFFFPNSTACEPHEILSNPGEAGRSESAPVSGVWVLVYAALLARPPKVRESLLCGFILPLLASLASLLTSVLT